jgi:hypothetical protein
VLLPGYIKTNNKLTCAFDFIRKTIKKTTSATVYIAALSIITTRPQIYGRTSTDPETLRAAVRIRYVINDVVTMFVARDNRKVARAHRAIDPSSAVPRGGSLDSSHTETHPVAL